RVSDYLKLQIQGNAVTINGESVLQTDVDGLGIRLQTATDGALCNARAGVNTENNRHAIPPARRRLTAPLQGRRHLIRDLTVMVD
ncbi:hypothetical protein MJL27_25835, partial [Salmonella enterica subsp. enterica serovar Anatum]|nr:hypothetical protein [Salmonella enterica subsp. enterica serovar Anatum]